MKILFYDLETTGLNVGIHGIHQLSGQVVINGEVKESFNFKVRPFDGAVYDQRALDVAGVTKEEVMQYESMASVYKKLTTMLSKYVDKFNKTDKMFLAGYNIASFDNNHFRQWFSQNGDKFFGSYFWADCFDVMVLASPYLATKRHLMPDFKQGTVAKTLGIHVDESKLHDAEYDINICKSIYDIVCKQY